MPFLQQGLPPRPHPELTLHTGEGYLAPLLFPAVNMVSCLFPDGSTSIQGHHAAKISNLQAPLTTLALGLSPISLSCVPDPTAA